MKTTIKMLLKLTKFSTFQKLMLLFSMSALFLFITPFMPVAEAQTQKYVVVGIGCKEHTGGNMMEISPPGGLVITKDSILFYTKYIDMVTATPENRAVIKSVFHTDYGVKITGMLISPDGSFQFSLEIKEVGAALWELPDGHEVALLLVKVETDN